MKTRIVHGVAGSFIFISLLLAIYVNINWLWFTAFIGFNLWLHALTGWCLMYKIVESLGFKEDSASCRVK